MFEERGDGKVCTLFIYKITNSVIRDSVYVLVCLDASFSFQKLFPFLFFVINLFLVVCVLSSVEQCVGMKQ